MERIGFICIIIFFGLMNVSAKEQVIVSNKDHALILVQFLHEQLEVNTTMFLQYLESRDKSNFEDLYRLLRFKLNESSSSSYIEQVLKKDKSCNFLDQYKSLFARMTLHTKQLLRTPKEITLYFENNDALSEIFVKTTGGDSFLISDEYLRKSNISRNDFEKLGMLLPQTK